MVNVKATSELDAQAGTLTVEMEFLPATELVHEILAALLDEDKKPDVTVDYNNVQDIVRAKLVFKASHDILKAGQEGLAFRKEAQDRATTPEGLSEQLNQQTAEIVKRAKAKAK